MHLKFLHGVIGAVLEHGTLLNLSGKNTIRLKALPGGVYFIKFTTEDGKTTTVKVVKKDD